MLQATGINAAVLDPFTVNPIDKELLIREAKASVKVCVLSVEDHYPEGGFGEVCDVGVDRREECDRGTSGCFGGSSLRTA